jgi:hypothetical protein
MNFTVSVKIYLRTFYDKYVNFYWPILNEHDRGHFVRGFYKSI